MQGSSVAQSNACVSSKKLHSALSVPKTKSYSGSGSKQASLGQAGGFPKPQDDSFATDRFASSLATGILFSSVMMTVRLSEAF